MEVSDSVVVLACQSTKTITIFHRQTMGKLHETQFTLNNFYGEQIQLISNLNGAQTFVFYTIRSSTTNAIGMFEVLINDYLTDAEQLVIDYG